MNGDFIKAFRESTQSVFGTMIGIPIEIGLASEAVHLSARHELSGIIGLSGHASGDVIVSFDRDLAIKASAALLGAEPEDIDTEVIDTIGELTNMIVGSAKGKLESYEMSLALPTVVFGSGGFRIGFNPNVTPVALNFATPHGGLTIEYALLENVPALV